MENQLEQLSKAVTLAEASAHGLLKSHVKGYTRTTASGATVQVQEHDDSRTAAHHTAEATTQRANKGSKDASKHSEMHMDAAHAHSQAAKEAKDNGNHESYMDHLKQAKHHVTESTSKFSGKGEAASKATDNANSISKYGGEIAKHAHEHASGQHKVAQKSISTSHPNWGLHGGRAKTHDKKAAEFNQ